MDITCPQCKTEYEFDDDKVTESGITVKCTNCTYMFRVKKRSVVETEPVPQQTFDQTPGQQWMIRTIGGQVFTFKELTTLQQWIVERKVSREDQISRSGETWKRLGEIAELSSFFQVVDAAIAAEGTTTGKYSPPAMLDAGDGLDEPAFSSDAEQFRDVGPKAAWEEGGDRLPEKRPTSEFYEEKLPKRGTAKMIGIIAVVAILVGAGITGFAMRHKLGGIFSGGSERSSEAYQEGRELFLLDDEASLDRALATFAKAPKESALAQAARAEVLTTWAQHLREEAQLLEKRAERAEESKRAEPNPGSGADRTEEGTAGTEEDPRALRLKASELRDEASKKITEAETYASAALKLAEDKGEVKRAMADYLRLRGGKEAEVMALLREAQERLPNDPELLYIEGALLADQGKPAAQEVLKQALAKTKARYGKSLLRAAFLLAVLDLRSGRLASARAQAEALVASNANHRWAKELLAALDSLAAAKVASAPRPRQDAGESPGATRDKPEDKGTAPDSKKTGGSAAPSTPAAIGGGYDAIVQRGNALSERGRTMQAFKLFEHALKLKPNGAEALAGIGYCHLDQERFSSAINFFKRALRVAPTFGEALIGMAEAYKVQGNDGKALDYYKAYLRTAPGGQKAVMARRNVADLERKLGATPEPAPGPTPTPAPDPGSSPPPGEEPAPPPETPAPSTPEP